MQDSANWQQFTQCQKSLKGNQDDRKFFSSLLRTSHYGWSCGFDAVITLLNPSLNKKNWCLSSRRNVHSWRTTESLCLRCPNGNPSWIDDVRSAVPRNSCVYCLSYFFFALQNWNSLSPLPSLAPSLCSKIPICWPKPPPLPDKKKEQSVL